MKTKEKERIYLDYQATTPVDPRVLEAMLPYWSTNFGNPHSAEHSFGWKADQAINRVRGQIADLINAESDEIIFTSGATESNNLALQGMARALQNRGRRKIVVSAVEHKCALESAKVCGELGYRVELIPVTPLGFADLNAADKIIDDDTAIVSLMAVNNEVGTIQPVREAARMTHKRGAVFHCDAAQALGWMDIDVFDEEIDLLSLSAHKVYGPKGIGVLFIRSDLPVKPQPIILGGGQERGFRSGTVPVPLAVGFGRACELIGEQREEYVKNMRSNRQAFLKQLRRKYPNLAINGSFPEDRHPGNLNVRFPGMDAAAYIARQQPYVAFSTGAACQSGSMEPSYVLREMGLSEREASESVRFSFSRESQERLLSDISV